MKVFDMPRLFQDIGVDRTAFEYISPRKSAAALFTPRYELGQMINFSQPQMIESRLQFGSWATWMSQVMLTY